MRDNAENRQTRPSSDVIRTDYFAAELLMEVGEGDPAERVAMAIRMQNNLNGSCAAAKMAPTSWERDGDVALLSIVGRACGQAAREEWWPRGGPGRESGYTVGKVAEYLEGVFGCSASVRALEPGLDHPDDLQLMDSFRRLFGEGRWRHLEDYPSAEDVTSAGKRQGPLPGSWGAYARRSPYFKAMLVSRQPADAFNRVAYAAACKALRRAAGATVFPEAVFRREDGRWELRMIGMAGDPGMFGRGAKPADPSLSDALAHYLDAEVESFRTFGTTVADADDIVEAERIADALEGLGAPEPEDFAVSGRAGAAARSARGSEDGPAEKTGAQELDELVGLAPVKEQILEFVDFAAARKERGGAMPSLHMWMTGNPGTGKTTVARIIGHIMHDRGSSPSATCS